MDSNGVPVSGAHAEAATMLSRLPEALVGLIRHATLVEGAEDLLPRAAQLASWVLGDGMRVSLMIGQPTAPEVVASTSALAQAIDGAQVMADEGPCATSFETKAIVVSANVVADERWPRLSRHLEGLDAAGAIAAPLIIDDEVIGSLNVFTTPEVSPDAEAVQCCELLTAAISNLVQQLRRRKELREAAEGIREALSSRAVIEQAKGIIMVDKRCSADQAFQHLVDLSSRNHVKLRDLAGTIVTRTSGGHAPAARPDGDDPARIG